MMPTLAQQLAIVTTNLTKRYESTLAADQISLRVPVGDIYGFLGPNGAGKTTVIRMLLGFIRPTAGQAVIFGHDVQLESTESRSQIGYLVPGDSWYPQMKGKDQLDFAARLSRQTPVLRAELQNVLGLSAADLNKRLHTYSKGMKQKLALIAAIQHDPQLLILDEPTDGLDPLIQHQFEEFLQAFRKRGRTVFMSSHDLAEVERTCDRVAIIRQGQIVTQNTVIQLKRLHRQRLRVVFEEAVPETFSKLGIVEAAASDPRESSMLIDADMNSVLAELARYEVRELTITPPSLDDVFLEFYNGSPGQSNNAARETET